MKLKTKAWPYGRNWPDAVVLDVGSNMPHDVYGLADNGAGVRYVRHDIAREYFNNSRPSAQHMDAWHKLKAAIGAPNVPAQCDIKHGDACPECGGCVRWTESQLFSGCCLECDECGETFWPRHNAELRHSADSAASQPKKTNNEH